MTKKQRFLVINRETGVIAALLSSENDISERTKTYDVKAVSKEEWKKRERDVDQSEEEYEQYLREWARNVTEKLSGDYTLHLTPWTQDREIPEQPFNFWNHEKREIKGKLYLQSTEDKLSIFSTKNERDAKERAEGLVEKVVEIANHFNSKSEISIKVEAKNGRYKEKISFLGYDQKFTGD